MHRLLADIGLAGILISISGASTAWAQQQFDGHWTIQATPTKGACSRAHHYAVTIENGTLRGKAPRRAHVRGSLDPAGRVQGSAERNRTKVEVSGLLSGRSGAGHWTAAGRLNCSGQWRAEKR